MSHRLQIEMDPNFRIDCLAPDGTGLGVGSISRIDRLSSGEIEEPDLEKVRQAVRDPSYYPPVEFGDDGCGDGRGTVVIYRAKRDKNTGLRSGDDGVVFREYFERSGHRSKIFGGGLNIGWVMKRVINGVPQVGETMVADRLIVAKELRERSLEFGGHTDSHATGDNIGCGALDKTVPIIGYAVEYADSLYSLTKKLKGSNFDDSSFNRTIEVFSAIHNNPRYTAGASGRSALLVLDEYGAIIKELGGKHNEVLYLRNHIPGTTFYQAKLNAETDDLTQVFDDDVWRRDMFADALGSGKDVLIKVADMAGEVLTLATTITLTDGSQEVFQRIAA